DVDGVTSAALLSEFLRASRIPFRARLPRRDREGYGLNAAALREAVEEGATLVLTADTGISSVAEARLARELGLDLVITDHHTPGPELPEAAAVVNPKLPGSTYPDAMIAGVGVAWNLAVSVRRSLREGGWYEGHPEPDVRDLLDLVALGTVADVAPLTKVNRALVAAGLKRLNGDRPRSGVEALKQIAGVKGPLRAGHIGFQLGPRLNAAGRMEGPHEALDLLLSSDAGLSRDLAARLDALNRRRQDEERGILAEALDQVKRGGWLPGAWSLVVGAEGWHEGVIGIVASRLADLHARPAVVIALPQGKGSARSISGLNLHDTLGDCAALLERFGGHAAAAGLKLAPGNLGAFREAFEAAVRRRITQEDLRPLLLLDAEVSFREMSTRAVGELSLLEPFGAGNPSPTLLATGAGVLDVRPMGREGEHLRFRLEQQGLRVDAVAWRKAEGLAHVRPGSRVDVAFTPQVSAWNGADRVQLVVDGMRPAAG
ncbi:MAG: single-stranded-DNA-specific exonuclease RecJ, partial [Deltaproteobacteria bacterium]|nr:single-stranded-DNA-specific exonuclease RecJ [Deltaproteobacteria bacterium]